MHPLSVFPDKYGRRPCLGLDLPVFWRTRTRANTNPNDTEANAAGRSGNARALRKQSTCGVYHEGRALAKILAKIVKSEAFVGNAHSAETIKRKVRERSS